MKITFIRHGHSQSNELNILSSSADDEFYLTDKGVAEIKKGCSRVPTFCGRKRYLHQLAAETYCPQRSSLYEGDR